MRILHLLASPVWTGPAENVAWLASAQRALGHQVSVAVDRKRSRLAFEEPAAPRLREMGLLDEGGLELSVKSWPWQAWVDARRLRARPLDVVHSHFSHDHFVARLGTPPKALLVRSIHAPRSLRRWMPRADAWTVPTQAELSRVSPSAVLPPLLDPAFHVPPDGAGLRSQLGLQGDPLVGMVSTFQPSRRHSLGVEAFAEWSRTSAGARLVLVGDGPLVPQVEAQVRALGISDRVTFAGYQGGRDFIRWLQALDTVWVLGLGNDWSARVAVQARACGVHVVAVAEGALPEYADAIVKEHSVAALLAASRAVTRAVGSLPSNERTAQEVLALYERAARSARRPS